MDYLKLFQTHQDYEAFVSGGTMVRPNVSHCVNENEVHYNPTLDWSIKTKYLVDDISEPTMIGGGIHPCGMTLEGLANVDKLIIDGVEMDVPEPNGGYFYQFASTGYHTVDYVMKKSYIEEVYNEETNTWSEVEHEGAKMDWTMFYGCENLFSLEIPNSVIEIKPLYLINCSLISINPNNIYYDSRNNCNAIIETATNILIAGCNNTVIPNSVTSIGEGAFENCSGLTSVTIPNSVTSIGDLAFRHCEGLTSVNIGNSVTSIGEYAFNYCISLTSVTIGNYVTSIERYTFSVCTSLTSVTIGNSVTSIGVNAFYGCTSLTSITSLATTAPTINSNTFQSVKTNGTLTVPSGSSGYDVWMGTGYYYLGKYNWTKVEQ